MFRVLSDWLHWLSAVFRCDVNTKVFVLSKLFSTKREGTVFFFTDQQLLQNRVHAFSSFHKSSTLEDITAMILDSSSRSVNRVGRI